MKRLIVLCVVVLGLLACEKDSFRTTYPIGDPQLSATMLSTTVEYGNGDITFSVDISETKTPLSTLSIKILSGATVVQQEKVRTPNKAYSNTFTYHIPLLAGMEDGAPLKVYLTAENVEGTKKDLVLSSCIGHRPSIPTMYLMPPTIEYTKLGKGYKMTADADGVFTLTDQVLPKSIECLFATVGTKFGRVDWTKPVFGMIDKKVALITQEQFEAGEATSIVLENENLLNITQVTFDPLTFEITYDGTVPHPITQLDVQTDLDEDGTYRSNKIYYAKDSEIELLNVTDAEEACNKDYFEYLGNNKFKFLGETGMYYTHYNTTEDYIIIEPDYDLTFPDVMWVCGVGWAHPSAHPTLWTSNWGFDKPEQFIACRTIAPKVYQMTVYVKNGVDKEDADIGTLNFKFFHQHGWGGEEDAHNYTLPSNWYAASDNNWRVYSTAELDGYYRITLNMNTNTTTCEKVD